MISICWRNQNVKHPIAKLRTSEYFPRHDKTLGDSYAAKIIPSVSLGGIKFFVDFSRGSNTLPVKMGMNNPIFQLQRREPEHLSPEPAAIDRKSVKATMQCYRPNPRRVPLFFYLFTCRLPYSRLATATCDARLIYNII